MGRMALVVPASSTFGDVRMTHEGQSLTLGLEAGDDLLGIHPGYAFSTSLHGMRGSQQRAGGRASSCCVHDLGLLFGAETRPNQREFERFMATGKKRGASGCLIADLQRRDLFRKVGPE